MRIRTNFEDLVEAAKAERELEELNAHKYDDFEKEKSIWPRLVAIFLVLLLAAGSVTGAFYYRATHQLSFRSFAQSGDDHIYVDEYFQVVSHDYLDELNIAAINSLYYKRDKVLEMMDHEAMGKIEVHFYGSTEDYVNAGGSNVALGFYSDGKIHILHPEAEGIEGFSKNYDDFNKYHYEDVLLIHEYVHAVHKDKEGAFPENKWITEGIADYISLKLSGWSWSGIQNQYKGQTTQINNFDGFDYGYEYEYGFTIVDYLVTTYGIDVISQLMNEPDISEEWRIRQITGQRPEAFFKTWSKFMVFNYDMVLPQMSSESKTNGYFVMTGGGEGARGTLEDPLGSIQEGIDRLEPGQTLWIMSGVYEEALVVDHLSGEASRLITIKGYGSEPTIIDGSNSMSDILLHISNSSNLTIENLTFRNLTDRQDAVAILVDGSGVGIRLLNNHIYGIEADRDGHGIAIYGTEEDPYSLVQIRGNHIENCFLGTSEGLVVNGNVTDFLIADNEIHDLNNIAVDCIGFEGTAPRNDQARNGIVRDNRIYNITSKDNPSYNGSLGANGIYIDGGQDIKVYDNHISQCDIGIEIASEHFGKEAEGNEVYHNLIEDSHLFGIALGGEDSDHGKAVDNHLYENQLVGNPVAIMLQNQEGNLIEQNSFLDNEIDFGE